MYGVESDNASEGTGADYLEGFNNMQELPKGKSVTLKYRIALDPSMTDGEGGVIASVVVPDHIMEIGRADLPFSVSTAPTTPSNAAPPSPRQSTLPFRGFRGLEGMAADSAGNLYVADPNNDRVLKLDVGASTQTVLPFTDLKSPRDVAVDKNGNVYATDGGTFRVLKLDGSSHTQTVLPFTGGLPTDIAIDDAGNVYVIDNKNELVLKLAAGANAQTVLPFTDLHRPEGLAVDAAGNVAVVDANISGIEGVKDEFRVLRLAAGATTSSEVPIPGVGYPYSLAFDGADNLYVADVDKRQVVKLDAGSNAQTVLPFTRLAHPARVAVDSAGNVYVFDGGGFGSVVRLAAS